jgi:hypothetical protein
MRVVMTLLARDEEDVIDAQLAFHLNAGVDFVVATDNRSEDRTKEIFDAYVREGYAHVVEELGDDLRQAEWVTRMARLAATDFGADWVLNADADEFWWPRGGTLKEILANVPDTFGVVGAFVESFVPRPDDGAFFAERMTARLSPQAPINDPSSPYRPLPKVIHRADPNVRVTRGSHALVESALVPLRGWYPIDVLHFPIRSAEQCERKAILQWTAFQKSARGFGTAYHTMAYEAHRMDRAQEYYDLLAVDDQALARGVTAGSLVTDTRLRDALRALRRPEADGLRSFLLPSDGAARIRFESADAAEEVRHAVDAAVLEEAEVVRLHRRLDEVEKRALGVEESLLARIHARLRGARRRS